MSRIDLGRVVRIATLALCGLVMAGGAGAATLTGVNVTSEGDVTTIRIAIDESVEFDHFTLADPSRFVLDCIGVSDVSVDAMPVGTGRAKAIQADVWKGAGDHAVTRIMVDLKGTTEAVVTEDESGLTVVLRPGGGNVWSTSPDQPEVADPANDPKDEDDEFGLTEAEEAFEFTDRVRPNYATDWNRSDEPSVTSYLIEEQASLGSRGGPRVSLDVQGADIYTVLRSISEYSGVNIVMGYDVRSQVTEPVAFHLENVAWGDALEMVLRSSHLWYREEAGIIRVDLEKNIRDEDLNRDSAQRQLEAVMPLTTRIVNVIYADAGELKISVIKSLSDRGMIEHDDRTNSLVVTDIPHRVESTVEMIQHLDSQTPQVEIVAKLIEVDARYSRDLGVFWGVSNLNGGGASGGIATGSNSVVDPAGVVKIGVVKDWGSVNAVLSALEQENKANIISNPRITTVNNRLARILVGQKIPLIVLDEAGNSITQLTTIGITLEVRPHINDNNNITLDMHPEVSDLSSQATVQGGVIINTSEADTRVMVGNGETAVIGGLIRSNEATLERGVPILKDIPILGGLFFKGTSVKKEKRELLIFVTPRIVNSFASGEVGEN